MATPGNTIFQQNVGVSDTLPEFKQVLVTDNQKESFQQS